MNDVLLVTTLTEWSAAVRARDGKCLRCGSTERLHAHHVKRKSEFPDLALDLSNGETLCNVCHAKEHEQDFPSLSVMLASEPPADRANSPRQPRKKPVETAPKFAENEVMPLPKPSSVPNADRHIPKPELVRALVMAIGRSQRWIAERIGISERRLRYLVAGSRDVEGKTVAVTLTYAEQFALECLASAAEAMRQP